MFGFGKMLSSLKEVTITFGTPAQVGIFLLGLGLFAVGVAGLVNRSAIRMRKVETESSEEEESEEKTGEDSEPESEEALLNDEASASQEEESGEGEDSDSDSEPPALESVTPISDAIPLGIEVVATFEEVSYPIVNKDTPLAEELASD